jgi:hypothetical protein
MNDDWTLCLNCNHKHKQRKNEFDYSCNPKCDQCDCKKWTGWTPAI